MKKLFITVCILLFTGVLYSQDVSIKKGEINIDNVPVAKIVKDKDIYIVSTMNDVPKLKMTYKYRSGGYISEVTNYTGDKMNVLKLQMFSFTTSKEKWLAENLIKGNIKLLDKNGFNDEQINNFLNTDNGDKSLALNINISNDEIQLDNISVAKIIKLKNLTYQVGGLKDDFKFTVEMKMNDINNKYWLQFKSQDENKTNEVYFNAFSTSLNNGKLIAEYLVKSEYHLIDKNGINESKVNSLLDSTRTPISTAIALAKKEQNEVYTFCNTSGIAIAENGNITHNSLLVGKLVKTTEHERYSYTITDVSNNILAQSQYTSMTPGCDIILSNKVTLHKNIIWAMNGASAGNKELSRDALANEIVNYIYYKGYSLENLQKEITDAKVQAQQEQIKEKQENDAFMKQALTITNAKGYVIDKDGKKTEGNISIEFSNLNGGLSTFRGLVPKSYGNVVTLTTTNEKGKPENQKFKAKDGIRFAVENNGGEETFIGTPTTEDAALGHSGETLTGNLGNNAQFYQVLYESDGNFVLSHKKHPTEYYLKLKGKDKAVYLGYIAGYYSNQPTRSISKNKDVVQKIFDNYVSCGSLNFNDYDTKTLDGMKKIVDDYSSMCGK